jgi:hypothetical protein
MDLEEVEAVFRRANAEERRARDEGRKPPPALAGVPRVGGDGAVVPDAVEYPLIEFPWEPWTLITPGRRLTQAQAGAYANWVNDARAGRLAVIAAVLEEAGAPSGGLRERPEGLAGLGGWIQAWFRLVAAPLTDGLSYTDGFFYHDHSDRLGLAWAAWGPPLSNYSRYGDALLSSLAHDLAFLVADCALAARPGLSWQAAYDPARQEFLVTPVPDPPFDLVGEVREFLVQSRRLHRFGVDTEVAAQHQEQHRLHRSSRRRARALPRQLLEQQPARADPRERGQLVDAGHRAPHRARRRGGPGRLPGLRMAGHPGRPGLTRLPPRPGHHLGPNLPG